MKQYRIRSLAGDGCANIYCSSVVEDEFGWRLDFNGQYLGRVWKTGATLEEAQPETAATVERNWDPEAGDPPEDRRL